ncbi:hypothetical protein ACWKWC_20450 [Geodermatophilus nigrescens]
MPITDLGELTGLDLAQVGALDAYDLEGVKPQGAVRLWRELIGLDDIVLPRRR